MPPRASGRRKSTGGKHGHQTADEGADAGSSLKKRAAKRDFRPPTKTLEFESSAPPVSVDAPPEGVESIEPVEHIAVKEAYLPRRIRKNVGLNAPVKLDSEMEAVANRSGHKGATELLRHATRKQLAAERAEERVERPPTPGSVFFDEPALRKAFQTFDVSRKNAVGAKELKHLFAQMGEVPTDQEIDGMIYLCDVRGEGVVSFEDFVSIFANPAEELPKIDVAGLREVVLGEKADSSSGSGSSDDESGSGSSSSS
jgi:hypothetical protein